MADVDATLGTLPPLPNSDTQSYTSILCRKGVPELKPLRVDHDAKRHQPKYHIHAMVLILIYVPLLVLPWILTCVIAKRPLSATSYFNSRGFEDSEIKHMYNSARAVNVMNSVGSLVTIPILSALIAQAAAAYSHKHRSNPNFRLQHLVALADRGWTDPIALARSWRWPRRGSGVRYLLHFASLLVLLGKCCAFVQYLNSNHLRLHTTTSLSASGAHGVLFGSEMSGHLIHACRLLRLSSEMLKHLITKSHGMGHRANPDESDFTG
jgi:hypothetical protein